MRLVTVSQQDMPCGRNHDHREQLHLVNAQLALNILIDLGAASFQPLPTSFR